MTKKLNKLLIVLVLAVYLLLNCGVGGVSVCFATQSSYDELLSAESIGIGGCACTNTPTISPFDSNTMVVLTDMGGFFVSHDAGATWVRKNNNGRAYSACFDPNNEGVIYVGGSGLWKSTDNGDTFELYYPNAEDIYDIFTRLEQPITFIYSKDENYSSAKQIRGIAINPNDSDNIYVLQYASYDKTSVVFESTDGKTFTKIFDVTCKTDVTKMFVDEDGLVLAVANGIYRYSAERGLETVYDASAHNVVDIVKAQDAYVFIEKAENSYAHVDRALTKVVWTTDFTHFTDITMDILTTIDSYVESAGLSSRVSFKANFSYLDATSVNDICLTNANLDAFDLEFEQYVASIFRYSVTDGERSVNFIYGAPFADYRVLENQGWSNMDAVYEMYGVTIDPNKSDNVLFTTLIGIYYYTDGKLYQRYTNKVVDDEGGVSYVTNGMDEQVTHGLKTDPFNPEHLFMCNTDLGLIESNNNGATWTRGHEGINEAWKNTCYDLVFDEHTEGVLYSVWSTRHYTTFNTNTYDEHSDIYGGFAISTDGGATWDSEYAHGLPSYITPVKLAVVYDDSDERTIYLTSFNCGTYVSYDSGRNFTELNNGIEKIKCYYDDFEYVFGADIEAKDGKVFMMTARSIIEVDGDPATTDETEYQQGRIYELVGDTWQKISLENYEVICPRDIHYANGILYITATTWHKYKWTDTTVDMEVRGGGIYAYDGENVENIYDPTVSIGGVQVDSDGTLYASDIFGNIYVKNQHYDFEKIYSDFHFLSRGLSLYEDANSKILYLHTHGGGMLKLELQPSSNSTDPDPDPIEPDDPVDPTPDDPVDPVDPDDKPSNFTTWIIVAVVAVVVVVIIAVTVYIFRRK